MRTAALVVVVACLAGCTSGPTDFSNESIVARITDIGGGYDVVLPLWLGDGASADVWANAFFMQADNGSFELTLTERGMGLHVWGTGTASLEAHDVRHDGSPRAFTKSRFSLGSFGDHAYTEVRQGDVDITWIYEGVSDGCYLEAKQYWTDIQQGVHPADLGSSLTPASQVCVT